MLDEKGQGGEAYGRRECGVATRHPAKPAAGCPPAHSNNKAGFELNVKKKRVCARAEKS
jgi:hypothetical protein